MVMVAQEDDENDPPGVASPPSAVEVRTPEESELLVKLEKRIELGMTVFVAVGLALKEIQQLRLYKGDFDTWDDYLRERWNLSRSYANRQISAAETKAMFPEGEGPMNEAQARALGEIRSKNSDEYMFKAWDKAWEKTEGNPTAEAITEARRQLTRASSSWSGGDTSSESQQSLGPKPPTFTTHSKLHELVPEVDDDTYQRIKQSIEDNGLRQPIVLCQGRIVDGRARYKACRAVGVEPDTVDMTLSGDALMEFIADANINRRHLRPEDMPVEEVEGTVVEERDDHV